MASLENLNLSRTGQLQVPDLDTLKAISEQYHLDLSDEELRSYSSIIPGSIAQFNQIALMQEPIQKPKEGEKREHHCPTENENTYNAWYVKCNIQQQKNGKLYGKRIAIKDNVAVAGIPMMNGSRMLEGYTPEYDATIVKRILDAGGCIVGKAVCEDLCLSGGSYMTTYGPVRNPVNPEHSAGGSSSGSAVVVARDEADMAIGGDQGGSIRIPASSCGLVGLKPTHGLVPYTGAMPIVPCLDHLGPITKTVADAALLLEVIAGYDHGRDSRQGNFNFPVPEYSKLIYPMVKLAKKLKIGILKEGVELCDSNVQDVFNDAIKIIGTSNEVEVSSLSLPMHNDAGVVFNAVCFPGTLNCMLDGNGFGVGAGGLQNTSLVSKLQDQLASNGPEIPPTSKLTILICNYLRSQAGPFHYAKACSMGVAYRHAYDRLLSEVDVIAMPTLNNKPPKIPDNATPLEKKIELAFSMIKNTGIFDVTGHPAITLNAGLSSYDKMPVGLMLVGRHMDEVTLLSTAAVIEQCLSCKQS